MTTYRPKGSSRYLYDFQFRGERYHGSTGCTSKREADAYERRVRHEIANPTTRKTPITVDEAAGLYAEHAETLKSWPTTRYILAALVKGLGARTMMGALTPRDLQLYIARRRSGRSNASINREVDVLRALWRRAHKGKYEVGDEPDWRSLYLRVPKAPPREMSEGEETAIFDRIADDARDCVMFALVSGWRRAEVIGLRWADVDLGRAEARTRVKGGDVEVRPLNAALVALIANQPKVGPFIFTYICRKSRCANRVTGAPARRKGERYPMSVTALRKWCG